MIIACALGGIYASLLWFIARQTARARSVALAGWPYLTIVCCAAAAACIAAIFPFDLAPLLSASVIGTIICAIVDARTGLIFDTLTIAMLIVAGALCLVTGRVVDGATAAFSVGGFLLALYLGTRRRGIGFGDVKLGFVLALGYGVQLSVLAIGSAFVVGASYAGVLIGLGRAKRTDAVRFGPFIAAGAVIGLTANVLGYRW